MTPERKMDPVEPTIPQPYYQCANCADYAPEVCCREAGELLWYENDWWCEDCVGDEGQDASDYQRLDEVLAAAPESELARLEDFIYGFDPDCSVGELQQKLRDWVRVKA